MPTDPPKACPCGGKKIDGKCDRCGQPKDNRPNSSQRGYTSRWDDAKEAYLRAHPICVCCLAQGIVEGRRGRDGLRVDHIAPARMAPELFWERTNWQTLCLDCDMRHKQPLEKRCSTAQEVVSEWERMLSAMHRTTQGGG